MGSLKVRDFSCIKEADLELGRMTVIIGPQASGKSVLCKLNYFFNDVSLNLVKGIVDGKSLEALKDGIKEMFIDWFPISAWGNKKFSIEYSGGDFCIRIVRTVYSGQVSDNFRIWFPEGFKEKYSSVFKDAAVVRDEFVAGFDDSDFYRSELRVYDAVAKRLQVVLRSDYSSQLFIPAGRSFFTNIGKAMVAFEQGRMLDPLTIRFGRLYTGFKDRIFSARSHRVKSGRFDGASMKIAKLIGGDLISDKGKEYIKSPDGRTVPISALSSGQQELLPLSVVLPSLLGAALAKKLVYIEEPEAHLFPKAQSELLDILASFVGGGNLRSVVDLVITTHSPYVLAKINNLIKAEQVSRISSAAKTSVEQIVSSHSWLSSKWVRAYSVEGGVLKCILDEESGLIDADYLDEVSGVMASEFMSLIEVECSHE